MNLLHSKYHFYPLIALYTPSLQTNIEQKKIIFKCYVIVANWFVVVLLDWSITNQIYSNISHMPEYVALNPNFELNYRADFFLLAILLRFIIDDILNGLVF